MKYLFAGAVAILIEIYIMTLHPTFLGMGIFMSFATLDLIINHK